MKKTILLISLIFAINAFAIEEKNISATMQQKIDMTTKILLENKEPITQKAQKIFKEIENVFDIKLMGRLALGAYWKGLTPEQQKDFTKAFDRYMKNSYTNKLDLYNGEKILITRAEKIQENRIHLHSEIQGEKEVFDIIYKFYKANTDDWLIYDVDILGVSIIKTYRAQFYDTLANNSFEFLLDKIKNTK